MKCEKCQSDMWDNRKNKKNPKGPDFKCKDKECGFAVWLKADEKAKLEAEEKAQAETGVQTGNDTRLKTEQEKKDSMILSYAKDLTIACIEKGWYTDSTSAAVGFVGWVKLLKQDGKLQEEPVN